MIADLIILHILLYTFNYCVTIIDKIFTQLLNIFYSFPQGKTTPYNGG